MKSFDAVKTVRDIRTRIFVEDLKRKPVQKVTPQATPQVTTEVTTEVKQLLYIGEIANAQIYQSTKKETA
jgi:hypothetical protein